MLSKLQSLGFQKTKAYLLFKSKPSSTIRDIKYLKQNNYSRRKGYFNREKNFFYSTSSNETALAIFKIPAYQKYGILISAISIVLLGSFAAVEKRKSKAIKESKDKIRAKYLKPIALKQKLQASNNLTVSDLFKLYQYFKKNIYNLHLVRYESDDIVKLVKTVTRKNISNAHLLKEYSFIAADEQYRISAATWLVILASIMNSSEQDKLIVCFHAFNENDYLSYHELSKILLIAKNIGALTNAQLFKQDSYFATEVKEKNLTELTSEFMINYAGSIEGKISESSFLQFPINL